MSVLVIGKFQGDTATFRTSLTERAAEYEKIAQDARAHGAVHHRFGIGDGFIVLVDEWQTVEQFHQFFAVGTQLPGMVVHQVPSVLEDENHARDDTTGRPLRTAQGRTPSSTSRAPLTVFQR